MATNLIPFSDEQRRALVNLRQQYEVWMEAERRLARLPYGLKWKTISGRDYLYEVRDRIGNGTSLGPRSEETEARYRTHQEEKTTAGERSRQSRSALEETAKICRALRLPLLPSPAASILREADRRGLLGSHLIVVGTNAMAAYAVEAGGRIEDVPDETLDFDMTWASTKAHEQPNPVWSLLKAVDSTYTMNTERPFQARNASAYEVELLAAPSTFDALSRRDQPRPIPLPEQEWLLQGKRVDHVMVARDGSPARVVVPDPRWFALQKLWLSAQAKRDPLKRPRDEKQGLALLDTAWLHMPQFPLSDEFEDALPSELKPQFARWKANRPARHASSLSW